MSLDSLAKTIWVTRISSYPLIMVSMSFLATYTTSMPRKNPRLTFTPKILSSAKDLRPVVLFTPMLMARLKIPARCLASVWKRQMKNLWGRLCRLSTERTTRKSHFLSGLTPHACMSGRDSHPSGRAAQAMVYKPTA